MHNKYIRNTDKLSRGEGFKLLQNKAGDRNTIFHNYIPKYYKKANTEQVTERIQNMKGIVEDLQLEERVTATAEKPAL